MLLGRVLDEVEGLARIPPRPGMRLAPRAKDSRVRANLWREPTSPARGRMRQETAARRDFGALVGLLEQANDTILLTVAASTRQVASA